MKRFNPGVRTPLDKLDKVIAILQQSPREPDSQIAHLTGVSRRQVNTIRHILDAHPHFVPQLLKGSLSIHEANTILRQRPTCQWIKANGQEATNAAEAKSESHELRENLTAWIALSRKILNQLEQQL